MGVEDLVQQLKAKIKVLEHEVVYLKERNRFLQQQVDVLVDDEFLRDGGED